MSAMRCPENHFTPQPQRKETDHLEILMQVEKLQGDVRALRMSIRQLRETIEEITSGIQSLQADLRKTRPHDEHC